MYLLLQQAQASNLLTYAMQSQGQVASLMEQAQTEAAQIAIRHRTRQQGDQTIIYG
jgi:hypothetical protein